MVEKRSCSKISGMISLESEIDVPGTSSSRMSRMRRSFSGLAKALAKQTAIVFTPRLLMMRAASRASASFTGSMIAPL